MNNSYQELQDRLKAEGQTKEEVMESNAEYKLDLDSLPKQKHNWVRRGIVVSCEHAGHSNHRHFLVGGKSRS